MVVKIGGAIIEPSKYNNYRIGDSIFPAFAIGDLGSTYDFFLVGAVPIGESSYPLLTGNILDSEGNVLFRLVRNTLIFNPGHCSKILGDHIGYEIHDSAGHLIFKVETNYSALKLPGNKNFECFVTTIDANFYDKNKKVVFKGGAGNNMIESHVPTYFPGVGFDVSEEYETIANIMLSTRGAVHKVLTGTIKDQDISLDGVALYNVKIINCKISVSTANFVVYGDYEISNSEIYFSGTAENIRQLVLATLKKE